MLPDQATFDPAFLGADADGGAVAPLAVFTDRLAVELHQRGIVHSATERALNGLQIGFESVGRKLDPVRQT